MTARPLTWLEDWSHVGCGWRAFLRHRGGTLLVAQGLTWLAARLLLREMHRRRSELRALARIGPRTQALLDRLVGQAARQADAARHEALLREAASGGNAEAQRVLNGLARHVAVTVRTVRPRVLGARIVCENCRQQLRGVTRRHRCPMCARLVCRGCWASADRTCLNTERCLAAAKARAS